MPLKPPNRKALRRDEPQSYMVRFVCEFVLEGDLFVTAKKADATKAARKQLATLSYTQIDELALYRKRTSRTGRVISEKAVRKTLGARRGEGAGTT